MLKCLDSEMAVYCDDDTINNLYQNYKRAVGVKCKPDLVNDNNKLIGVVIFTSKTKKVNLNQLVEFDEKRIKWSSDNVDEKGFHFFIVDPYWCRKYTSDPSIDAPVKIYDNKTKKINTVIIKLKYKQFVKRRMFEFFKEWPYYKVAAIDNYDANRYNGHWFAINITVKHYHIDKEELSSLLAKRNKKMAAINNEWTKLKNDYYEKYEVMKSIDTIYNRPNNNIVKLRGVK